MTVVKESDITKEIISYLKEEGHFAFKHWGGMMGMRGISDIIGVQKDTGVAFFLEVKKPGGKPDESQEEFLYEVQLRGAIGGVVRAVEDVKKLGL